MSCRWAKERAAAMKAWTSTASTRASWARMMRLLPGSGMGGVGTRREAVTPNRGEGRSVGCRARLGVGARGLERLGGRVRLEALERGQVGHQVRGVAADLGGVTEGEAGGADAGP